MANDSPVMQVQPIEVVPNASSVASSSPNNPFADAEDDHAAYVATGAPLSIRPPADVLARAPILTYAPLPPRRPDALSPDSSRPDSLRPAQQAEPEAAEAPPPAPQQQASLVSPGLPQVSTPQEIEEEEATTPEPMLVEKQTDAVNISCLAPELMKIVRRAGEHFKGVPIITSGQRTRGRQGSYHRKCMAADFFIAGVERARLAKYLRALPDAGGVGTYCHTKAVHIDIGEPRNWYQCGFRFRFSQR